LLPVSSTLAKINLGKFTLGEELIVFNLDRKY
jgi:hypothetical protein